MTQPRAADDFEVIRERLEELRREREQAENANKTDDGAPGAGGDASDGDNADGEAEREARRQGAPPAWVPTIFLPQPTD